MGIVLQRFIITVVDFVYEKEMEYTLYASSEKDARQYAWSEYGKSNVKKIKKA